MCLGEGLRTHQMGEKDRYSSSLDYYSICNRTDDQLEVVVNNNNMKTQTTFIQSSLFSLSCQEEQSATTGGQSRGLVTSSLT